MRFGKAVLLLFAALIIVNAAATPAAAASSQAECVALYLCLPNQPYDSVTLLGSECLCCKSSNLTDCTTSYRKCAEEYCTTCNSVGGVDTCTACFTGHQLFNGHCVQCAVPNCDECMMDATGILPICNLCKDGFHWNAGACVVNTDPSGPGVPHCRPSHCKTCSSASATHCATCMDGYTLDSSSNCVQVCTVEHCDQCDSNDGKSCRLCSSGYRWVNSRCVSPPGCRVGHCTHCKGEGSPGVDYSTCETCEPGYTLSDGYCFARRTCTVANCALCLNSPSQCDACNPRYGLVNGACVACTGPHCAQCNGDANVCSACSSGYTLQGNTCVPSSGPCNVPNCITCAANDPSTCMYCASGYYVLNGQCAPASTCYVANCAQCMLRDGTKCSTCRNGYLLSSTYTCLSQHINVNGATAPHSPWVAAAVLLASAITYLV